GPAGAVLGDDAGDFAMDVFDVAEAFNVPAPGVEFAVADDRLGHVIDDYRQRRVAFDKFEDMRQVFRVDQDVEGQAEFTGGMQNGVERLLQNPIVLRDVLEVGADAFEFL